MLLLLFPLGCTSELSLPASSCYPSNCLSLIVFFLHLLFYLWVSRNFSDQFLSLVHFSPFLFLHLLFFFKVSDWVSYHLHNSSINKGITRELPLVTNIKFFLGMSIHRQALVKKSRFITIISTKPWLAIGLVSWFNWAFQFCLCLKPLHGSEKSMHN